MIDDAKYFYITEKENENENNYVCGIGKGRNGLNNAITLLDRQNYKYINNTQIYNKLITHYEMENARVLNREEKKEIKNRPYYKKCLDYYNIKNKNNIEEQIDIENDENGEFKRLFYKNTGQSYIPRNVVINNLDKWSTKDCLPTKHQNKDAVSAEHLKKELRDQGRPQAFRKPKQKVCKLLKNIGYKFTDEEKIEQLDGTIINDNYCSSLRKNQCLKKEDCEWNEGGKIWLVKEIYDRLKDNDTLFEFVKDILDINISKQDFETFSKDEFVARFQPIKNQDQKKLYWARSLLRTPSRQVELDTKFRDMTKKQFNNELKKKKSDNGINDYPGGKCLKKDLQNYRKIIPQYVLADIEEIRQTIRTDQQFLNNEEIIKLQERLNEQITVNEDLQNNAKIIETDLQTKIKELQGNILELQQRNRQDNQNETITNLQNEIDRIKALLLGNNTHISKIEEENRELKNNVSSLEELNEELKQNLSSLNVELTQSENELVKLKELNPNNLKINELEVLIETLKEESSSIDSISKAKIGELEVELLSLNEEIEKVKLQNTELTVLLEQSQEKILALETEVFDLRNLSLDETLKKKLEESELKLKQTNNKLNQLKFERITTGSVNNATVIESRTAYLKLSKNIKRLEIKIKELKDENQKLNNEKQVLQKQLSETKKKLNELEEINTKIEELIQNSSIDDKSGLEQELKECQDKLKNLQDLSQDMRYTFLEKLTYNKLTKQAKKQLKDANTRISQLTEELDNKTRELKKSLTDYDTFSELESEVCKKSNVDKDKNKNIIRLFIIFSAILNYIKYDTRNTDILSINNGSIDFIKLLINKVKNEWNEIITGSTLLNKIKLELDEYGFNSETLIDNHKVKLIMLTMRSKNPDLLKEFLQFNKNYLRKIGELDFSNDPSELLVKIEVLFKSISLEKEYNEIIKLIDHLFIDRYEFHTYNLEDKSCFKKILPYIYAFRVEYIGDGNLEKLLKKN